MVGLAFVIAASANFPVLMMAMSWSGTTTRGALVGGWLGLLSSVGMVVLGPAVWRDVLGHAQPVFPYANPGLFSITLAFLGIWLVSLTDRSAAADAERRAFRAQYVRSQTGLGPEPGRPTRPDSARP